MRGFRSGLLVGLTALVAFFAEAGRAQDQAPTFEEPQQCCGKGMVIFTPASVKVLKEYASEKGLKVTEALGPIIKALEEHVRPQGIPVTRALPVFLEAVGHQARMHEITTAQALPEALHSLEEFAWAEEVSFAQLLKHRLKVAEIFQGQPGQFEEEGDDDGGGGNVNCWYECFGDYYALCCDLDGEFQGCGGTSIKCGDGGSEDEMQMP